MESNSTDTSTGLRDRAFISLLTYTWPRVSSAVNLLFRYYYTRARRWYFDLNEKGSKQAKKLAHHRAQDALDAYLEALNASAFFVEIATHQVERDGQANLRRPK